MLVVTVAVFQSPMFPYVLAAVVGLATHADAAVAMLAFVMAVHAEKELHVG
jgi:hypothetical protein